MGTPFLSPKSPPKKFVWAPLLRSFPGNEAHKHFLGGGAKTAGVLGQGANVYVDKVYVFCCPLLKSSALIPFPNLSSKRPAWFYPACADCPSSGAAGAPAPEIHPGASDCPEP